MALKEEFDYLSFRCCYCLNFNPGRKKRPAAPKLEGTSTTIRSSDLSESDGLSSSATSSDSDLDEARPIVTEPSDSNDENKIQVDDKRISLADTDKLSDFEVKSSDTESSLMEAENISYGESKPEDAVVLKD